MEQKKVLNFLQAAKELNLTEEARRLLRQRYPAELASLDSLERPAVYTDYSGKAVGIKFQNMIIWKNDAPLRLNYREAMAFCDKTVINNTPCKTFKLADEKKLQPFLSQINKLLESIGGEPLKTGAYYTQTLWRGRNDVIWLIGLHNNSSDFYSANERAWVRPVLHLEDK